MFLHYHQNKTKTHKSVFQVQMQVITISFSDIVHIRTLRSLISHIHSTPLAHSPHSLCSARSFSASTLLCSLILHIHSAPLAHSPHPLHPLIDSIRQRRKNAHEIESPYTLHPHSSCLQVQVSEVCSTSKETNMCYNLFLEVN